MKEEEEEEGEHTFVRFEYFKFLYIFFYLPIVCSNSICFHFISKYQDVFTFEPQKGRQQYSNNISLRTYVFLFRNNIYLQFFFCSSSN